jgi:hypothetical protein
MPNDAGNASMQSWPLLSILCKTDNYYYRATRDTMRTYFPHLFTDAFSRKSGRRSFARGEFSEIITPEPLLSGALMV